jgi:hypothetical protein
MTETSVCIIDVVCVCECMQVLGRNVKISKNNLYRVHVFHVNLFGITRNPLDGPSCNFILENFLKMCRENSVFI